MAVWARVCAPCEGKGDESWYVSAALVSEMPAGTRVVQVRQGTQWRCAVLGAGSPVSVDQALLRDAIASTEADCPGCRRLLAEFEEPPGTSASPAVPEPRAATGRVQAAAMSIQGARLVVVLVAMELLRNAGEAEMAIETLAPNFGGAALVLMAQEADGSPRFHGEPALVELLSGIALERMPWKEYPVG